MTWKDLTWMIKINVKKIVKISSYFNRIYKPELLTDNEIGKSINKCELKELKIVNY